MKKEEFDINLLIEKYRWWIGGLLLLAIVVSGGLLISKNRRVESMPAVGSYDTKIAEFESRLATQSLKITELEAKINDQKVSAVPVEQTTSTGQVAGAATQDTITSAPISGKVNLNTANLSQLDSLPGIGEVYAQRIIDYRQSKGGFKDIVELKNVKGIGDKTFEKLRDLVSI